MEFEKRFDISVNRKLIYQKDSHTYSLREAIFDDGKLAKTYYLFKGDDYGFGGWTPLEKQDINKISFEFDINHPLYMPLFHLLNYDDELIIDDDETREFDKKYMCIYRNNNKIYIDFINNLNDNKYATLSEKFNIFIKNVGYDGRSKIDSYFKDTKERLNVFFNEVDEILANDFYQITTEEYLVKNKENLDDVKKFYKKIYRHTNL